MIAPCGVEIKVGQKWQEVDPRFERYIYVSEWNDRTQKVGLCADMRFRNRLTWAMLKRFNAKRCGYKLVKEAPDDLQK